jgi:hypothetical protein
MGNISHFNNEISAMRQEFRGRSGRPEKHVRSAFPEMYLPFRAKASRMSALGLFASTGDRARE